MTKEKTTMSYLQEKMAFITDDVNRIAKVFGRAISKFVITAFLCLPMTAMAHPDENWGGAQLVLHQWAEALINDEPDAVESFLSSVFRASTSKGSKDEYIASIKENTDITKVTLARASYQVIERGIRVSPIIIEFGRDWGDLALSVDMAEDGVLWKIASFQLIPFPTELVSKKLPEHFQTYPIQINLSDSATGNPVFARVHIADAQGDYWPPRGHQKNISIGWNENVGGDVRVAGKTFAYVAPSFVVDLPPGKHGLQAVKGMEYTPANIEFTVSPANNKPIELSLTRWVNMPQQGWYSGDTHTHFLSAETAALEAQAEDLNVVNVLATKWGELITNTNEVTGRASKVSTPTNIVFFNEETRHEYLGHTILHPIKQLIYPLSWGDDGSTGVYGGYDYPTMAHQADQAHKQGSLVTWAHFPFPYGELAIDVALGKIDSVDLFTWGDAFRPIAKMLPMDLPKGATHSSPGPVAWWYKFLNTGFKLPVTAGTDKMLNSQVSGSVRAYAFLGDEEFTYERWIDAIRQGRTFVTTGPMISFKANGQTIGSELELKPGQNVTLEVEVRTNYRRYPVERIEIVKNGKVIETKINVDKADLVKLSFTVSIEESAWFAARAYHSDLLPYNSWTENNFYWSNFGGSPSMVHTSPIYITIPGSEIWSAEDAKFLAEKSEEAIVWAKTEARYQSESEREEVIKLFKKAKVIYQPHTKDPHQSDRVSGTKK